MYAYGICMYVVCLSLGIHSTSAVLPVRLRPRCPLLHHHRQRRIIQLFQLEDVRRCQRLLVILLLFHFFKSTPLFPNCCQSLFIIYFSTFTELSHDPEPSLPNPPALPMKPPPEHVLAHKVRAKFLHLPSCPSQLQLSSFRAYLDVLSKGLLCSLYRGGGN